MGINYNKIASNSVGYKGDYEMHSMDFEEFLWAKGYDEGQIEYLYSFMAEMRPYPQSILNTMFQLFREYMVIGGMPEVVNKYITQGTFSGLLDIQKQLPRNMP